MQKYDIQTSNGEKSKQMQNIENAFGKKKTNRNLKQSCLYTDIYKSHGNCEQKVYNRKSHKVEGIQTQQ